jgi:tyrosyl-tRNA synthetase
MKNAKTYQEQFFKVVDKEKTEVRFNGEWFSKMSFMDVMRLASKVTVARLLERDDFANRYANNLPISLHELYYPVMQAYDSVAMSADIEIGATEQKFNLLMGRQMQQIHGQEPQIAITLPVLEGIDGVQRMSKSLGNYVGVSEKPGEMFGKLMSIPDTLVIRYFELLTPVSPSEIEKRSQALSSGSINPRDLKSELAETIVSIYHGKALAASAREEFDRVFRDKGIPDDVRSIEVTAPGGKLWIVNLLREAKLVSSGSDGRRLVQQGAVEIDGVPVTDEEAEITLEANREVLVRVGKRRFAKVRAASKGVE